MTVVELRLWNMGWGRRMVLFALATIGSLLLGIALSAALARPAAADTLPLPSTPSLRAPVTSALGSVGDVTTGSGVASVTAPVSNLVSGVTGAAGGVAPLPTLPGAPLPTLPITSLPIPSLPLPVITKPTTDTPTAGGTPADTTGAGPVPGIGGAAHGSAGTHTVLSSSRRFGTAGSLRSSNRSGTPTKAPTHRVPAPSFPTVTGIAGDATTPGHGDTPWNAVPLTILLLTGLGLGGVFLHRRLGLKPLFDSRLAPPG